jgi:hypothetical protein
VQYPRCEAELSAASLAWNKVGDWHETTWIEIPSKKSLPLGMQRQSEHIRKLLEVSIEYINYIVCFKHAFPDSAETKVFARDAFVLAFRELGAVVQPISERMAQSRTYRRYMHSVVC